MVRRQWMVELAAEDTAKLMVNAQNDEGDTMLHTAVKTALREEAASAEEEPPNEIHASTSALDQCLRDRSARLVLGFSVSELACAQRLHNKHGLMPIHIAAAHGNAPVCEALLKAGAPLNAKSIRGPIVSGHFCHAPQWGKRDGKGGKLKAVAKADKTALHFAVGLLCDRCEECDTPSEEGEADTEADEGSEECDTTLVRLLLSRGADVNAVDFDGATPFHMAVIDGNHELVALLAAAGADLSMGCKSFGKQNTALHLATLRKDARMVALLTGHGAPVDATGRDGWTPLGLAARQGSADVAKALIAAGADVFAPSANGKTPLEIATTNAKHRTQPQSAVLELLRHEVAAAVLHIAYSRAA